MNNILLLDNVTLAQQEIDDLWRNINSSPSDHVSYWILTASFIFAIFGSISNLMSVIVLYRLSSHLSTFVYLTGLSISDMITCILIVVTHTLEIIVKTRRNTSILSFLRYVGIAFGGLASGSRVLSFWISTAVTMDRWILICYPMYGKTFCTLHRAKVVSRTLFIIAFLYSIPLFFEYEIVQVPNVYPTIPFDNESSSILDVNIQRKNMISIKGYSDLAKRRIYRWSYMFFNAIFVYIVPTITIVFFNFQLIRALHRVKSRTKRLRQKHHTNGTKHSHRRRCYQSKYSVTIIVIAMVLTLLICRSPTIVIWVLWSFELTIKIFFDSSSSSAIRRFHNISNLIAIINAATNFLPFCVFGQLFRTECLNIYCCRTPVIDQLSHQAAKKYEGNSFNTQNNQTIKINDNIQQPKTIKNDHVRNTLTFNSDTTSSPNRSISLYSSTNIVRLSDSTSYFAGCGTQHSKVSSPTTQLLKETIDL